MASAAIVTVTFRVRSTATFPTASVISNQGTVDSDQTVPTATDSDGNPGNGAQPTDIAVDATPQPALRMTKTVALTGDVVPPTGTINVGDQVTYTVVITNTGNVPIATIAFTDTVPAQVTVTGVTNATWSSGQTVTASFSNLAVGASVTLTITGTVNAPGSISNQGTAYYTYTGGSGSTQTDGNGNPGDGNQPTDFVAQTGGGGGSPVLAVNKLQTLLDNVHHDGKLNVGESIRYVISVSNTGSAAATNVTLTDPVPANTTVVSVLPSAGSVVSTTPSVIVNFGTLNSGETETVTITASVNAGTAVGTIITNQASVTATELTGSTNSNSVSAPVAASGVVVERGVTAVPALDAEMLVLLATLLALAGTLLVRRRR